MVVAQVYGAYQGAALLNRLEDSLNDRLRTDVLELILVDGHLIIAEIDEGQRRVVLDNLFDIEGMLRSMKLVVLHGQGDQPLVVLDPIDNWPEVLLKLII